MKKYILIAMFFLNFAFVYEHGQLEVKVGTEMRAQNAGNELGEVSICSQRTENDYSFGCAIFKDICYNKLDCSTGEILDSQCLEPIYVEEDPACNPTNCSEGNPLCICGNCQSECTCQKCDDKCTICDQCYGYHLDNCPNKPDCNGDVGGDAYIDNCLECVGGNTGNTECDPCEKIDDAKEAYLIAETRQNNLFDDYNREMSSIETQTEQLNNYNSQLDELVDEQDWSYYNDAVSIYQRDVNNFMTEFNNYKQTETIRTEALKKLTAAGFEYAVTGSVSINPVAYYNTTQANFTSALPTLSGYADAISAQKSKLDLANQLVNGIQYNDSLSSFQAKLNSQMLLETVFRDSIQLFHNKVFGPTSLGTIPTANVCLDKLNQLVKEMDKLKWYADSLVTEVRKTNATYLVDAKDYSEFFQKITMSHEVLKNMTVNLFNKSFIGYVTNNSVKTNEAKCTYIAVNYLHYNEFNNYYAGKRDVVMQSNPSYFADYTSYFERKTLAKLKLISQAQNDWNAFVSGKFVSYLGKSSESELSATKTFFQDLDNLVKAHQPDTTIAYGERLLKVIDLYNPVQTGAVELKKVLRASLDAESNMVQKSKDVKSASETVNQSKKYLDNVYSLLPPQVRTANEQANSQANAINQQISAQNVFRQPLQTAINERINQFQNLSTTIIANGAACVSQGTTPQNNSTTVPSPKENVVSNGKKTPEELSKNATQGLGLLIAIWNHFQAGGTKAVSINASSLNFSMYTQKQLGLSGLKIGETKSVNLFNGDVNQNSLVWGRVYMTYMGNNQFQIESDKFDFNFDSEASWQRNAGTALGKYICYSGLFLPLPLLYGGSFDIYVNGYITINK